MRPLSRLVLIGAFASLAVAPSAVAAPALKVDVKPNKGGTITVGAKASFTAKLTGIARAPLGDGSVRMKAVSIKMPPSLLFNTIPFTKPCKIASFLASKTCNKSTKLGSAVVIADGADAGLITATVDLYFGSGFTILSRVQSSRPAIIDVGIVGSLRSSADDAYGLEMYIPLPPKLQQPLPGLFPTVQSITGKITPFSKKVTVPGTKGKVDLPIAGLGPCPGNKKLPFAINVTYTDPTGLLDLAVDGAATTSKCKR